MKKLYALFAVLSLVYPSAIYAQTCGTGGVTTITNQTELNALSGCVTHNGAINFQGVPANIDFSPLNSLQTTGGLYFVFSSMTKIEAFPALTTINGDLGVSSNGSLEEVKGFPALTSVYGGVDFSSNQKLKHIDGLYGLDTISGILKIYNNDSLGMCCGVQYVLANMKVGGSIDLQFNKAECNSESAITSADCSYLETSGIAEEIAAHSFKAYPNPMTANATIEISNPDFDNFTFRLYDLAGRELRKIENITENRFSLERKGLLSGLYMMELTGSNGASARTRLIVQ